MLLKNEVLIGRNTEQEKTGHLIGSYFVCLLEYHVAWSAITDEKDHSVTAGPLSPPNALRTLVREMLHLPLCTEVTELCKLIA